MKKVLVLAAALALAATPAAAQEAPTVTASMEQQSASAVPAPSIFVSPDEIRQRVAANEAAREGAQLGSTSWWYTVLAVALGVLIAMLLLD